VSGLDVPVLALFGGRDRVVPAVLNAGVMSEALEIADVEHLVEVIPAADHSFEQKGMFVDPRTDTWVWPDYSDQARELILDWIQQH
jgi:dienelactone hydrolase